VAASLVCDHDHPSNVHLGRPAAKKRKKVNRTSSVPLPVHHGSPEKQSSLIEVGFTVYMSLTLWILYHSKRDP